MKIQLSMHAKILSVASLLLLPLVVTLYFLFAYEGDQIRFVDAEVAGVETITPLLKVLFIVPILGDHPELADSVTPQLASYQQSPRLPDGFFHGFLDRVGSLLDCLFSLPDRLVGLSFVTKLVVAGQCPGGFLDSTFYHVCLATHDGDSYS